MIEKIKSKIKYLLIFVFMILMTLFAFLCKPIDYTGYINDNRTYTINMSKKNNFSQKIYSNLDKIQSIIIPIKTVGSINFSHYFNNIFLDIDYYRLLPVLQYNIQDKSGNVISSKNVSYNEISLSNNVEIDVSNYSSVKWEPFTINLKCINCNNDKSILIFASNKTDFHIESNYNERTLNYNLVGGKYDIKFILFVIIIDSLLISYYLYKLLDSIKLIRFNLIYNCVLEILFSTAFIFSYIKIKSIYNNYGNISFAYMPLLFLSLILLGTVFIIGFKKWKKNYEKLFLLVIIPLGIMYMFCMLPNWVADENQHYYKAYTISTGKLAPVKNNFIPKQIINNDYNTIDSYEKLYVQMNVDTDYNNNQIINGRANLYNSILYLPSALGIYIGRILNLNIFVSYYLARFMNFLLAIILGYYAIKIFPLCKFPIFVYMLNPMYIHQAISLSEDCMINAISILFISYILYLKNTKNSLNGKNIIIMFILMFLISTTKYVYAPLIFLSFILFNKINKKNKILILGCIILSFIFALFFFRYTGSSSASSGGGYKNTETTYVSNVMKVVSNPVQYIYTLENTLKQNGNYYIDTTFGKYLGWLNIPSNNIIIYAYITILILSCFLEKKHGKILNKEDKWLLMLISLIIFNLIFLGFYLTYIDRSMNVIHGIQGRYFIPFLVLPILVFCSNINKKLNIKNSTIIIILILININVITNICNFFL